MSYVSIAAILGLRFFWSFAGISRDTKRFIFYWITKGPKSNNKHPYNVGPIFYFTI